MADIVIKGDSIEGKKIKGSSRKPIEYKGIMLEKGKRLYKFTGKFNSKSSISEKLSEDDAKIVKEAKTSVDDRIFCDDVILRSLDRKVSIKKESNDSATHGTSSWSFPKQTNAMITRSHEEIENAINKREIENKEKKMIK